MGGVFTQPGSKAAVLTAGQPLPVYPDQRTFSKSVGMSQRCHMYGPAARCKTEAPRPTNVRAATMYQASNVEHLLRAIMGIRAVISYFEVYPEVYHHPQEDLVFAKLRERDPVAAAKVGDLAREHHKGAERLRRVAHAVENVLADGEVPRQNVDTIVRDFIAHERHHMMMEDRDFFPAALKALKPQDWTEIA